MERNEIPTGFAMALARNPEAMKKYAELSEDKKQEVIARIHSVQSRDEMHRYVNDLATDKR